MAATPDSWALVEEGDVAVVTVGRDAARLGGLDAALDALAERAAVRGVVLRSDRPIFCGDSDPSGVLDATRGDAARLSGELAGAAATLRRLETIGLPVVALIGGSAVGDGLALALAAHRRIALRDATIEIGLPQVRLGLLPGHGALTRVVRIAGLADALTGVLLEGRLLGPEQALKAGLVDELVDRPEDLMAAALEWIDGNRGARQPWDREDYRMPGGTPSSPRLAQLLPAYPANLRKQLKGAPYPAPRAIMAAAVEGAQLDFAGAIAVETRYLVELRCGRVAKNMVHAFHADLPRTAARWRRTGEREPFRPSHVAVLGAGMMGAAIAYVVAAAGCEVTLRDISLEAAERGKAYAEGVVRRALERGRIGEPAAAALLGRIAPTAAIGDAAGAQLVIEAVFEDAALKAGVLAEIDSVAAPDAVIASNTSTLPIGDLARSVSRRHDFLGLHFFSPAERMPLLEIIAGRETSAETIARALDLAALFGKTAIVVNDARGFFTSRVITTMLDEAIAMVGEGIPAASIEQASLQAGYP
ncbi:MAG TPA: 3-hydroxyacyl-CoA dehydrogenase NAD-binding domain-containing protein, partial [Solirubrobacteraceae bacterium]|nr:3-hydroxyacyl-CoA dehydrogenase NAD-binding domain-containing protein [Solirubrobacteraceae bacterium]